ncbi:MAG TPA: hypothetical protein VF767_05980 [Bryobacteraceae bacterium]
METKVLYHGTTGDAILGMIGSGTILPSLGKVYFSEWNWQSVLMHGADRARGAAFAVKLAVQLPDGAGRFATKTPGVADTLVVMTNEPLQVEVLELFARRPTADGMQVDQIKGVQLIRSYLLAAAKAGA